MEEEKMETEEIIKSEENKLDNDKDTDSGIENENSNKDNDNVENNKKKNQTTKTLDENNKRNSSANLRRKSVDSMQGDEPENKKVKNELEKTENIERQKYDPEDENFDFENISTTVNRFNKDLMDTPIQGEYCNKLV